MSRENELTVKDVYGNPLRKGTKVAFNYSGVVAIGHIEEIKTTKRYGETKDYAGDPYFNFHIRHQNGAATIVRNRLSVTNIE